MNSNMGNEFLKLAYYIYKIGDIVFVNEYTYDERSIL